MRISKILLTAAVLALMAMPARADIISIVADEWCPYNCTPGTPEEGIFIEIARSVFEKEGHVIEYKILPWTRAVEEATEGKYTALTGASKGDAPGFVFPEIPQAVARMAFFVKNDSPWNYDGVMSLEKVSLGAIASYSYSAEMDKYIEANSGNMSRVQLLGGDTALADNIAKLLKGRIGALIESENVMKYYLMQNEMTGQIREAGSLPQTAEQNLFLAFSPKNPKSHEYARLLTDGMKDMEKSGELEAIFERYGLSLQSKEEPVGK